MYASQITGSIKRREFLAGASLAATWSVVGPAVALGSRANSVLRLGMIGCGGRGTWIADLFARTGQYQFVACADYFPDRAGAFGERLKIEPGRRFTTLSGYKRLLDEPLDAVVIETPPYFHPEQAAAAVDAGKHVYLAKPMAVDVPGCMTIAEAGKKATAKKLVYLIDFQTRANELYIETLRRVHQGDIGRLVSAVANYPWAGTVHDDHAAASPEERLRLWYQTRALCGDVIVEQDIHAIDVATWFAGADPIKAIGTGSRSTRKHGDIWGHFAVIYAFPDNFQVSFTSQKNVPGVPDEIRCLVYGTEGIADTDYTGAVTIRGKHPYEGGRMTNLYTSGAQRNIESFYNAITSGKYDNPTVVPSVRSNLTSILGRTAAYRGREVSWSEMITECETLKPDLTGLKS
jgi:myo-inositol 2-dehydrogenase / D-chiro-inositol 1-dehydrogenase